MIRLIVHIADAGMAGNIGGPVQETFKTFDIDHPELEKLLTPSEQHRYREAFVAGCEVLPIEEK
jgi:hypothetical protein